MKSKKKTSPANLFLFLLTFALSLIIILPLLIMLFGAFKNDVEAAQFTILPPTTWHFENFAFVIQSGNILRAFFNSFLITTVSVVVGVFSATMAGFIIQRRAGSKGASVLYYLFFLGMIAPVQIVTSYAVLRALGLLGSYVGIILMYVAINLPFSVFLYTGFMQGLPREVDEAAIVDGCSVWRVYFSIILPLLKPVIATNVVIFGMSVWNDFQLPLYFLSSPSRWTMPLTVYNFFGQYFSNWNYVFADLILTALPILLVYLFAQRYIVAGMTQGAVKG